MVTAAKKLVWEQEYLLFFCSQKIIKQLLFLSECNRHWNGTVLRGCLWD